MFTDIKTRLLIFLGAILLSVVFLLPTIKPGLLSKSWLSKPISLGLDLRGGGQIVYEVITSEAVKAKLLGRANTIKSDLREQKIAVLRSRINEGGALELTLISDRLLQKARELIEQNHKDLPISEARTDEGKGKIVLNFRPEEARTIEREAVDRSIETLRNRVDQFGVAEPLIQRGGEKRIILQMPGVTDVESVKRVVGSVAKLEFRFVATSGGNKPTITLKDRSGSEMQLEDEVLMTGDLVKEAIVVFPDGRPEISLTMTSEGAKIFRKITTENVSRNMAIILDNTVYSAPTIREPIIGGQASISGQFTFDEARELGVVLRSGSLAAPLQVIEERTVGPSLGAESIRSGIKAILAGAALIFVFMLVYYRGAGLVANIALALNLLFILGLLAAFGATLTLPGIAGLALTVGMAVDANVLIFERIRDELRNGASIDAAVRGGFDKALVAILDSNVTTLLAGMVLYMFGSGPIRGFAVTMSIGILTTLFCATFVSRLLFDILPLRRNGELSV